MIETGVSKVRLSSWISRFGVALFGSLVGGVIVWISQVGGFHIYPIGMSYSDLAAVLLTAVAVIVAIFAGVLALAAVWGFSQLKREAVAAAEMAGAAEVKHLFEKGSLHEYIKSEVMFVIDKEFMSEQMNHRINNRVDAIVFGRPDDDQLLEGEED